MPPNFLSYKVEHLRKINSMRRAASQPDNILVPILTKGQVFFTPASQMHDEPASCYNCVHYNYGRSCQKIGENVPIKKFTYPKESKGDSKPIEYWPCCSIQDFGEPNYGEEVFISHNDPSNLGLGWINAPKVGQEHGGANCGGQNDGDDCDHYITEGSDKREEKSAFCRVLQCTVNGGDVCSAWDDDDLLDWQQGVDILRELDGD